MNESISFETTRERLNYNPETGIFTWRVPGWTRPDLIGQVAGTLRRGQYPYRMINVEGEFYLAHRLAWLWMTGTFPDGFIDHINGDQSDNSWANLRLAEPTQNNANSRLRYNNLSGCKGVTYAKHVGRWKARIQKSGKQIHIGYFRSAEEAHAAYVAKAREMFGEFARPT